MSRWHNSLLSVNVQHCSWPFSRQVYIIVIHCIYIYLFYRSFFKLTPLGEVPKVSALALTLVLFGCS